MIEAELHGKVSDELQDVEDLLVSAVFGLLQYVPPTICWPALLGRAESCEGKSFVRRCRELGVEVPAYGRLDIHFWPVHQEYGEPDLLLVFSGAEQLPLCFLIEAKLWASKSGSGERDQLNRYLAAMKDSRWLGKITGFRVPMALPGLIYLTPRSAWLELHGSIEHASDQTTAKSSLFLLHWQDILEAARQALPQAHEPQRTMLGRIADFLEHRGLAYFRGFDQLLLRDTVDMEAHFYSPAKVVFSGFTKLPLETESLVAQFNFYASKR